MALKSPCVAVPKELFSDRIAFPISRMRKQRPSGDRKLPKTLWLQLAFLLPTPL